jgi:hypothetical protein
MIQRRAVEFGMKVRIGCHTFRATGITAYLETGGTLENAQAMAAHESPRTTKLPDPSARVFISYSRKDGAKFAATLRKQLEREELCVWQDLIALEGDQDWWSQIEDALRSKDLQHFVLVVTLAALESHVVRQEIRLARQEGKTVCPVKGPGLADLSTLPRWLGNVFDLISRTDAPH